MKFSLTLLSLAAISVSHSSADTILTSDGNGADAFIQQGQATTNFGATTSFTIKGGNAVTTRKAYLRFDLSTITQTITDASLTLTVALNNSGGASPQPGQTFNVDIFGLTNEALDNWVEGDNGSDDLPLNEITYTNAPANINPGNDFNDADVILLGTLNIPGTNAGETVTFSDPSLATFLNSDTNGLATILMRRQLGGSNNLSFATKEGNGTPQLDFTTGSTAALEISEFSYDPEANAVTLTWPNSGTTSYVVKYSTDLADWQSNLGTGITTAQDERTEDPENITLTFDLSEVARDGKIFFRVEEE